VNPKQNHETGANGRRKLSRRTQVKNKHSGKDRVRAEKTGGRKRKNRNHLLGSQKRDARGKNLASKNAASA